MLDPTEGHTCGALLNTGTSAVCKLLLRILLETNDDSNDRLNVRSYGTCGFREPNTVVGTASCVVSSSLSERVCKEGACVCVLRVCMSGHMHRPGMSMCMRIARVYGWAHAQARDEHVCG